MFLSNNTGLNSAKVADFNKRLLLSYIYTLSNTTITELAHYSELTVPAVSRLVNTLEAEDKIEIAKSCASQGRGKSAGTVCIKNINDPILCIEIKHDVINLLKTNKSVSILGEIKTYKNVLTSKEQFIENLIEIIKPYCNQVTGKLSVAMAIHGQVDPVAGISLVMPQAPWHEHLQIKFLLEKALNVEVLLDNDCVMNTLAQKWYLIRQRERVPDICVINLDYGIGSSFLINNNIYRGTLFGSGQIGHTIIEPNGQKCACGRYGCLETIASSTNIKNRVNTLFSMQYHKKLEFDEIVDLYHKRDKDVVPIVDYVALCVGRAIYNLLNTININQIYLYGNVCKFGKKFLNLVLAQIKSNPFDSDEQIKELSTFIKYGTLSETELLSGIAFLFVERELGAF